MIGNNAFLEWVVSDWDQTWEAKNNPEAVKPTLDWSMKDRFVSPPNGSKGRLIRDLEEAESAVSTVFWFRNYKGLEKYYYDYDYETFEDEDYEMCSDNTKLLVRIY